MAGPVNPKHLLSFRTGNKNRRQQFHIQQKKARDVLKREERFRRKKEEGKSPRLREERLARNVPHTIDSKRTYDDVVGEDGEDMIGLSVNLEKLHKRRRVEEEEKEKEEQNEEEDEEEEDDEEKDEKTELLEEEGADDVKTTDAQAEHDSDLDSWLEDDEDQNDGKFKKPALPKRAERAASPNPSTASTRMDLTPEALALKFPSLFEPPTKDPKILITTTLNSTLHAQADLLTALFPHSHYVRRTAHRFGHKFSVKEIASFAANRNYTTILILTEDKKKPSGLDVVHLPDGPM
jgi:ribosome production factor 1